MTALERYAQLDAPREPPTLVAGTATSTSW
jgi:hypothetical protein